MMNIKVEAMMHQTMKDIRIGSKAVSPKKKESWIDYAQGLLFVIGLIIILILPVIGEYGHKPEDFEKAEAAGHFKPVANQFTVSNVRISEELINSKITQVVVFDAKWFKPKDREYCKNTEVHADSVQRSLIISKPPPPIISRPSGWSHAKDLKIEGVRSLDGVRIYTKHQCHNYWKTTTVLKDYLK